MDARLVVLSSLAGAALVACAPANPRGSADAGAGADAGAVPAALPLPFVRMADPLDGTSHSVTFEGSVVEHGPARENPFTDGSTPARELQVRAVDGSLEKLFYTLPTHYFFAAFPNDQLRVLYREKAGGTVSSYGARVETNAGKLIALFEDGEIGPAFDDTENLGFTFTVDPQPLAEEDDPCGRKVHHPLVVKNGSRTKRLFPGQSETFTLADGESATFTLFDAFRIEDASCPGEPDFSLGYFVKPSGS